MKLFSKEKNKNTETNIDVMCAAKESKSSIWKRAVKMKEFYFIMLLPFILVVLFSYIPMYGVIIAFKDFKINHGIWGSEWVGFENFTKFFNDYFFWRIIQNTLSISLFRLTLCFACPIIFALLLNEIANLKFKRIVQTISYLPHFMSWVVISGFVMQLLSPEYGIVNYFIELFGGEAQYFMGNADSFLPVLISSLIWQGVGWGAIVYLAAIAGIDPALYEAAEIDGATRFQKVLSITLPSIMPMITILFILSLRSVLQAGFDPVYNLQNDLNISASQTIETYVFEQGIYKTQYSYSAAIGLFQNMVGLGFLLISNAVVKKINDQGIF